ncbi:MAG: hypothetical protein V3R54_02805 [Thermodesulfovibrionia bacterium]
MNVVGLRQCALDYLFVIDSFPLPDTKKTVNDWMVCGGGTVATAKPLSMFIILAIIFIHSLKKAR